MNEKSCKRCGELKPFSAFYKHQQMADGHLNICIECTKSRVARHRKENIEYINWYDRLRANMPNRVEQRRLWSEKNKRKSNRSKLDWQSKNSKKRECHIKVGNALRSGRLQKQPCVECGDVNSEAHHPDYSKPFDVVWLCKRHHNQLHVNMRNSKRASFQPKTHKTIKIHEQESKKSLRSHQAPA